MAQVKSNKAQEWRWEYYWNEPVDNLYKFHIKLMQEIYNNYSGSMKKPGEENFMSTSEFAKIWEDANLQNDRFANRDVNVCFNLAMQTRVDELSSDKHLKMSFVEFLEAVARAANYLSYPPPTQSIRDAYKRTATQKQEDLEENKYDSEEDEEVEISKEELMKQPLNKKIENILPHLLTHCTKRLFRKKWTWPVKNPKYGLYEDIKNFSEEKNEVKSMMTKGLNKLIFAKLDIKGILKKKQLGL